MNKPELVLALLYCLLALDSLADKKRSVPVAIYFGLSAVYAYISFTAK